MSEKIVKRYIERFPEKFRFQLTQIEFNEHGKSLRSHIVTLNYRGGRRYLPYVSTADLVKSAKKSIVLIDNYMDETAVYHFGTSLKDLGKKWIWKQWG